MDTRQGSLIPIAGAFALSLAIGLISSTSPARAQPASAPADFMDPYYPYDAFETLSHNEMKVPGGVVRVGIAPGDVDMPRDALFDWINTSWQALAVYYGKFPVRSARLLIVPAPGRGIRGGQAFGHRGAAMRLIVGGETTGLDFDRDWRLVHEMIHLALPRIRPRHSWLSEGLAVYVESIARVQAGHLEPQTIWHDFMRDMPKGLPHDGDQGLDNTPTWGRTYWGGALFCLLADIEMRKRSNNRLGLQDAMRGVLAAGGDHEHRWPIERILKTADDAVQMDVLQTLYTQMKDTPTAPDLDALWKQLGVSMQGDRAVFDDNAELAAIRRAITTRPASTL